MTSRFFQRTNWDSTKRLMYGSLLCLSQDGFDKNNLFAVIADKKSDDISKSWFTIYFTESVEHIIYYFMLYIVFIRKS